MPRPRAVRLALPRTTRQPGTQIRLAQAIQISERRRRSEMRRQEIEEGGDVVLVGDGCERRGAPFAGEPRCEILRGGCGGIQKEELLF
jgi:hypothetical protein